MKVKNDLRIKMALAILAFLPLLVLSNVMAQAKKSTQDGTALRITFANPKNGGMEAKINGQYMEGEWHVPEKDNKTHTYRFIMQRAQ